MGRKRSKHFNLPANLRARAQKSGKTYYYYDTGEKPRREIPLGTDYPLAVKRWAELEIDTRGHDVQVGTFRHVAERYAREVLPRKALKTQRDNVKQLATLYKFFDNPPAPLSKIQPIHIRQYLDWRKAAPVSANREKSLFSHIWNKSREWGYTSQPNPCAGVKGYRERSREIYIEDEQYKALWDAADEPTRDAMDLCYLTMQRPADVLKMSASDIRDGMLHVRQNKTGARLRIEITGELASVMSRITQRKRACEVLSIALICDERGRPLSKNALRNRFDRARAKSGMQFQFRDLRAKAVTDKSDISGARSAQKQAGHGSITTTEIYLRARRGEKVGPTK